MRKFLTIAAFVLLSTAAFAKGDDVGDYTDKTEYTCDKDDIEEHMKSLASNNILGPKVLYIKEATEVVRTTTELKCKIVVVHSKGKQAGFFRYFVEDGHALVQFKPGR